MCKRFLRGLLIKLSVVMLAVGLFSCGSTRQLKYFQDLPDTTKLAVLKVVNFTVPVIHPDQVLSVNIYTIDLSATASVNAVNQAVVSTQGAVSGFDASGYLVDRDGYIEMPELGKIRVEGLNIEQAQTVIKTRAAVYFNDPIVIVKNKSFKISFIGEFQKTGTFIVPSEKFTILDAMSFSGGLTDFGQRNDVLLLRQNSDGTALSSIRLDLKSSSVLISPYYYLQNNDVLVANPTRSKGISTDQTFNRYLALYSLIGSLLTTFLILIKR